MLPIHTNEKYDLNILSNVRDCFLFKILSLGGIKIKISAQKAKKKKNVLSNKKREISNKMIMTKLPHLVKLLLVVN